MKHKTKQEDQLDNSTSYSDTPSSSFIDEDDFRTSDLVKTLARKETRVVNFIRSLALFVLLGTGILVSAFTYSHLKMEEQKAFELHFGYNAAEVIESFHTFVEHTMGATAGLSNQITGHALETNSKFPLVTLPNFEMRGSDIRAQSGSHMVYYAPVVTDEARASWEEYALGNRKQLLQAKILDSEYRKQQDASFGLVLPLGNATTGTTPQSPRPKDPLVTVLDDGYHPHIPAGGAIQPRRDQEQGNGPFAPLWQQSPIQDLSMAILNNDMGTSSLIVPGILHTVQKEKKAIINPAAIPAPHYRAPNELLLRASQYRHRVEDLIDDLHTWLVYPVFDTFDPTSRSVAGIIVTDVYWKILFSNLLPFHTNGIVCVISNSFGQNFTYRLDGGQATLLGMGDLHDEHYEDMVVSTNVGSFLERRANPANMAYGAVPLSKTTEYNIRVYPSQDNEASYLTNGPQVYTTMISLIFFFAIVLVYFFAFVVDRRQNVMTLKVVEKTERMAKLEQNLNEFFSHEIRNPLASALTAASFLQSTLQDPNLTPEAQQLACEDIEVVTSSLHFINDFMRSMLDIYRAAAGRITAEKAPTDVKTDILESVAAIIRQRGANYTVQVECPENLIIMTDRLRLNQIVLNLARNATKFVEAGFIRLGTQVDPQSKNVLIYVEDSGPGVPEEKRKRLFSRYQTSLDLLHQGTGIGLNLSKELCKILGAKLWLDEEYNSGFRHDCPGARFVINMKIAPMDIDVTFPDHSCSCTSFHHSNTETEDESVAETPHANTSGPSTLEIDSSSDGKDTLFRIEAETDTQRVENSSQPKTASTFVKPCPEKSPKSIETELPEDLAILFVDDDPMIRKLTMRAIQKISLPSWKIQEASSGEMALEMCDSNNYHIIFLDQYMASISKQLLGTETAILMRTRGIKSKICGLSANELAEAFKKAGAEEFILKPMPCHPTKLKPLLLDILNLASYESFDTDPKCVQKSLQRTVTEGGIG